jgi:hypothetical protein
MKIRFIHTLACLSLGAGLFTGALAQSNSQEYIDSLFAGEKSLKEIAATATQRSVVNPLQPGRSLTNSSLTTRAALWGDPGQLTLSLLKTDVIDRRYIDKDHDTMLSVAKGQCVQKSIHRDSHL